MALCITLKNNDTPNARSLKDRGIQVLTLERPHYSEELAYVNWKVIKSEKPHLFVSNVVVQAALLANDFSGKRC